MSLATLKQRLPDSGLSRRYVEVDDQQLKEVVQRETSREFIKSILPEITLHCCHGSIFRATVCSQKLLFSFTHSIKLLAGTSSLFFDLATSNQRIFLLYPSVARCIRNQMVLTCHSLNNNNILSEVNIELY